MRSWRAGGEPAVTPVFLHGFGQRYDLQGPLIIYLLAAAGVVVISFVMIAVLAGEKTGAEAVRYPRRRAPWLERLAASPWLWRAGGLLGVLVLVAIVVTGFFGNQKEPADNPAEYLTWIYFWAGTVILSGLAGNLWALFSPFSALAALLPLREPAALPERLGVWPAVAAYFLFACLELTSGMSNRPWLVAALAVVYTLIMLVGAYVFGREAWLNRCEAFTVLFNIVGRFAPLECERGRVYLRPWGVGLLKPEKPGWDRILFLILMLSTLAFDGILATPAWQNLAGDLSPYWQPYGQLGFAAYKTIGLICLSTIFLLIFLSFMRLVMLFGQGGGDPLALTTAFAYTLVPIALVYNAAHNYTYLVVQSQVLWPLLSDPLGRGWHLLPALEGYQPSFTLANAAVVWFAQVVLIVLGHVIAVYLAHLRAGERFKTARSALLSQYPMLTLMVIYTMTSLWILAQPVTREPGGG